MGLFSSSKSFYQNICSALDNNDVRKIKTILVNANRKKVVLKLNENKLLMKAINTNNIEIFKELINYINTHKLLIPFNEKDEYGRSILYYAVNKNNSKMVKEVLDNADKRNIVLKLNEKYNGNYPISKAILNNNVEIVQLLLGYAKKHKIIMKYDENFLKGENLLYWAINKDNISMAIQLMQNNDEVININKKMKNGEYSLLKAVSNNSTEMVELLMEYASAHNIILELNEKDKNGRYPLLMAAFNYNIQIAKLLVDYANSYYIELKYNDRDFIGSSIYFEIIELLNSNKNVKLNLRINSKITREKNKDEEVIEEENDENEWDGIGKGKGKGKGKDADISRISYDENSFIKSINSSSQILVYEIEKEKNEKLEKEKREKEEKLRKEREILEREKNEKEKIRKERSERQERERLERERIERELIKKERIQRSEREERERLERERIEKEKLLEAEREKSLKEKLKLERMERKRIERERLERELIERERIKRNEREERERLEREERERHEREERKRLEREERERHEREERERHEREERERHEREERERLEREERERLEREERERHEREERERIERRLIEKERIYREERERQERERIEREEREKQEKERIEREERERQEKERIEREERERQEKEERERIEREERERQEKEERERIEREERERKEKEERERIEREEEIEVTEAEEIEITEREIPEIEEEVIENFEREAVEMRKEERERIEKEIREIRENEEIKRIEIELREKIEKELREKIEKEVKEKFEKEMREKFEKEEREKVQKEEQEKIEKEMRIKFERERKEKEQNDSELIEELMFERERLEREKKLLTEEKYKFEKEREISEKQKKLNQINSKKSPSPKTPTLVIALNDFSGEKYDQLDINKDEFLVVTNWECDEEGWVFGHRKDNKEEKGLFPKVFVEVYNNNNNKGIMVKSNITTEYRIQYENKIKLLRSLMYMQITDASTVLFIHRNNLFHDAFNSIMSKTPEELRKKLCIEYIGEEGLDAGGLLRDFFYQLSKEIGNVNYSLFQYAHDNSYELEINPNSGMVDSNHLDYFRFIGRVIGLAIFHKQYLSVFFTILIYKKLLNKPLEFSDLRYVDYEMFRNLKQLKENDGANDLYLTFQMEIEDCFGHHKTIELKPNGANIDVTDSNKNEYIDLITKNKLNNTNDNEQLNALKQGFYEIIPENINILLDEVDLKYVISGISEVDVDDWENNTDYEGYKKDDITIINFWKCVRNFSHENRTKLLLFATGNSQVPVTGFKDLQGSGKIQPFKIKKIGHPKDLPKSHTCFNRIDLPPYTSFTQMKQKLLLAISEGMGNFSIE